MMFGGIQANFKGREEVRNDPGWHPELKKMAFSNIPEDYDPSI